MQEFSLIDRSMRQYEQDAKDRAAMQPAEAWPESERTHLKRDRRVAKSIKDFWFFDRTYFTPEMYSAGYAKPCTMHYDIERHMEQPGVQIELGPRDHGKTVTGKKVFVWRLLTGKTRIGGTYSHTLPTSQNILRDIADLIETNPRIMEDFGVMFEELNTEQFRFRARDLRHTVYVAAFSEGKSVRGYARMFDRPEMILGDDIETLNSPLGGDHTKARIKLVSEAYLSLSPGGTFVWFGNNFDERCATNQLLKEQEQGILSSLWCVHVYDAWTDRGPLWRDRFPAKSEEQLRSMLRPRDEADWQGNFRQRPMQPDGEIFKREHYTEYDQLPDDAYGVLYADPNTSLKGMGDTTAVPKLLYSPTTDLYYVPVAICESFSDTNLLLDGVLDMRDDRILLIGWDGHVTQEATWTNHIRNWCRIKKRPFPRVEYKRYHVDLLAKNIQAVWNQKRIQFAPGFAKTRHGEQFLAQLWSFDGKKSNRRDDAPDALICAFELIHEIGYAKPAQQSDDHSFNPNVSITDTYIF